MLISVGATVQDPSDLRYLYENHENFALLPTYYLIFGAMGCMRNPIISNALPDLQINPMNVWEHKFIILVYNYIHYFYFQTLHGEQYLEIYKVLPVQAKIKTVYKVLDFLDKGKGTVVLVQRMFLMKYN